MFVRALLVLASLGMCLGDPVPYAQDLGSCVDDKDCYVPKTYCYQTGKCVFCTDCSVHHRRNAMGVSCAKNKDQCGDCLPGTKAEITFDKSIFCVAINSDSPNTEIASSTDSTTNSLDPDQNQNSNTGWIIYSCIAVALILLIAFLIYVIIIFPKHCKTTFFTTLKNTFLMPESSYTCPTAPNFNQMNHQEIVPEEYRIQPDYRPFETDHKVAANPCCAPSYVRRGTLPNYNPDEPEHEPQTEEEQLITPRTELNDDDATTPSDWTPETILPDDRLTSFANLNLNATPNSQPIRQLNIPTTRQDSNRNRDSFHNNQNTYNNTNNNPPNSSGPQMNIHLNVLNVVANAQISSGS